MQFKRLIALGALTLASLASQAALTTLSPPAWPPGGSSGLEGVLFNVVEGAGSTVALGAHGYKNGALLPNDGESVFYAQLGTYPGEPNRANWSFDFYFDNACGGCSVILRIDTDRSAGITFAEINLTQLFGPSVEQMQDSWNFMMPEFAALGWNPNTPSITSFELALRSGTEAQDRITSSITVITGVPEPESLALVGIALAGLGLASRRRFSKS